MRVPSIHSAPRHGKFTRECSFVHLAANNNPASLTTFPAPDIRPLEVQALVRSRLSLGGARAAPEGARYDAHIGNVNLHPMHRQSSDSAPNSSSTMGAWSHVRWDGYSLGISFFKKQVICLVSVGPSSAPYFFCGRPGIPKSAFFAESGM